MKQPRAPRLDSRRAKRFEAELLARARAWMPSWGMDDDERDFGRALLKIAARFSSEVAERLDGAGDKMKLHFLDWLAVQGKAARPARLPIAFKLTDSARDAVLARAPTRLQVEAADTSVILETEKDVYLLPGRLKTVIGVDVDSDAFYLPPPGLSSLEQLEPLPAQWQLKTFVSVGGKKLQLDPETGLLVDMLVELGGHQYRIIKVEKDIVAIEPPLLQDQAAAAPVTKVSAFAPFDGEAHNQQEHVLYLGHKELLDIESPTTIEVVGARTLTEATWQYWGKDDPDEEPDWRPLPPAKDQTKPDSILLEKPKASMVLLELTKGIESRWIRARVDSVGDPLRVDGFEIRINCDKATTLDPASVEAMANTTPLVLDNVFFPLGREPRVFDAFYLGSKEAFSKKGAVVTLDFRIVAATFTALTAVRRGKFASLVLAGIGEDGALHLYEVNAATGAVGELFRRGPLRPSVDSSPEATPRVQLDARPKGRPPVWEDGADGFFVAAAAGNAVWLWHEDAGDPKRSTWTSFDALPPPGTTATGTIADLVYIEDISTLFALRDGKLFKRVWPNGLPSSLVEFKDTSNNTLDIVFDTIVPVLNKSADVVVTSAADGMVGVSKNDVYSITPAGVCSKLDAIGEVDCDVRPVAIKSGVDLIVALARKTPLGPLNPVMLHSGFVPPTKPIPLKKADDIATGFAAVPSNDGLNFLVAVQSGASDYLATWTPPATQVDNIELFRADIPAGTGRPDGGPVQIGAHTVIPGGAGDLLVGRFDVTKRRSLTAPMEQGIVIPSSAPPLQPNDVVTVGVKRGPSFESRPIKESVAVVLDELLYSLDTPFPDEFTGALYAFRAVDPERTGETDAAKAFKVDKLDNLIAQGALLKIGAVIHRVVDITPSGSDRLATLDPLPQASKTNLKYKIATAIPGRLAPLVRLSPANNDWDADILKLGMVLVFSRAVPSNQPARAFVTDLANHPLVLALGSVWNVPPDPPPTGASFFLAGSWTRSLGETSTSPDLSWEYWNGTGWWKLDDTKDGTQHLKNTGTVKFTVPRDLSPTDWSGRTNYWIRARLVGGDYGRERVSVVIQSSDDKDVTVQTIKRSSSDIHPPSVTKLNISYKLCEGVRPTFVFTKDSGSLRDQSDANRTDGAIVEAFVPLAVLLGRLSGAGAAAEAGDDCAPPDCQCPGGVTAATDSTAASAPRAAPTTSAALATGRALYLGFEARLTGEPVNVLLLAEERAHDTFAPMSVEVLTTNRFDPIAASDTTRALGESGVLSMSFTIEPKPRELFGQSLAWLRLTPKPNSTSEWKPNVKGAYFNAVWANAAETLTRELVGSSQGEPNLSLHLAKPPVLLDTLELRVKEPLSDDERRELNAQRKDHVLSDVENLPGDWVLWTQVIDPADELPTARVYALDEATGEIRFGDGLHGTIPPVGRDSIVAFNYRRTETGKPGSAIVPANTIEARTALSLVSPVEGVEAVFAADQAAGGAPPEDPDRVLRFGVARLRHRGRAVTARDFEDLVLESSPDIAQARCFAGSEYVHVVVVMRGSNPTPSAAQVRELKRLLLANSAPSLGAKQALRIDKPKVRRLRVDLKLGVASLDDAGQVKQDTKKQIAALFDTVTGGPDQDGWTLGENPTEAAIAMALARVPRLESIARVDLREIRDGGDRPWPPTLKPNELAMLDKDGIRVEFQTFEAVA